MTIRTTDTSSDNNRWTPECIDVRFNGEPIYCQNRIPYHIGTGGSENEVASWTDSLANNCNTCWNTGVTHISRSTETDGVRVWVRADATRLVGLRLGQKTSVMPQLLRGRTPQQPITTTVLSAQNLRPDTVYHCG